MSVKTPNFEAFAKDADFVFSAQNDLEGTGEDWEFESCELDVVDELMLSAMREFDASA